MLTIQFLCPLPNGLHARPAWELKEQCSQWQSEITFINHRQNAKADAKSSLALIGTGTLMRKEGYLYEVGVSYIVLFSDGVYTVCDLDSIRYAAFTSPGNRSAAGPARGGRRGGL